jgi:hypothetical protein
LIRSTVACHCLLKHLEFVLLLPSCQVDLIQLHL